MMTLDKIISHALEQCSIYGEYEFEHLPLRVVVYDSGLQAWYVPGDPFEWVPVSADFVMDQLDQLKKGEPAFLDEDGPSPDLPHRVTLPRD